MNVFITRPRDRRLQRSKIDFTVKKEQYAKT